MNRTTLSLIAAAGALAAVTGFAAATAPGSGDGDSAKAAARLPVERSSLLCPAPSSSDLAETAYTSYTPASKESGSSGKAALSPATRELTDSAGSGKDKGKADKPVLSPQKPGKPVAGESSGAESPALVGSADGNLAPGWTVQQTTEVAAGTGRGL